MIVKYHRVPSTPKPLFKIEKVSMVQRIRDFNESRITDKQRFMRNVIAFSENLEK